MDDISLEEIGVRRRGGDGSEYRRETPVNEKEWEGEKQKINETEKQIKNDATLSSVARKLLNSVKCFFHFILQSLHQQVKNLNVK